MLVQGAYNYYNRQDHPTKQDSDQVVVISFIHALTYKSNASLNSPPLSRYDVELASDAYAACDSPNASLLMPRRRPRSARRVHKGECGGCRFFSARSRKRG